jgi:hypothetical protein
MTGSFCFFLRFRQRYAEAQDLTVVPDGFYQRDAFFDSKFTAGIAKSKETLPPTLSHHSHFISTLFFSPLTVVPANSFVEALGCPGS